MTTARSRDPRMDADDLDARRDRVDLADLACEIKSKLSTLETLAADAQRLAYDANERAKINTGLLELLGHQLGEVRERLGELAARTRGPRSEPPQFGDVTQTRILAVLEQRETERDAAALRKMKGFGWRLPAAAALAAMGLAVKMLWHRLFG